MGNVQQIQTDVQPYDEDFNKFKGDIKILCS